MRIREENPMKILWAAMLGLTAAAWTFEGDWSTWDGTRKQGQAGEQAKTEANPSRTLSDPETGVGSIYGFRSMGRSESRWMGSLDGRSPSLADLDGKSRFDWTRWLGRAEAHHIDGARRTAWYVDSDRKPASEPLAGRELGCNMVEANRDKGRAEARDIGGNKIGAGNPPATWEMDGKTERDAAAKAAGATDC